MTKEFMGFKGVNNICTKGKDPMRAHQRKSAKGFTLVEEQVVIGIIALLISILLPALNKAKRAANTLACMANLRSIAQTMQIYATEQKGWILGSPETTGAFLNSSVYTSTNCPMLCEDWDWESPVATLMKASYDVLGSTAHRTARFVFLCNYKPFMCPENDALFGPFDTKSGITAIVPLISYNAAAMFLQGNDFIQTTTTGPKGGIDYHPKITKVGNPSLKIFMADGGKFNNQGTQVPDYNLKYAGLSGESNDYADYGAGNAFSEAYLGTGLIFAMRHGARVPGRPMGEYKFNAVFFDGHAETLDARTGSNPNLWMPKGATVPVQSPYELTDDAVKIFNIDKTKPYPITQ